MKQKSNKITSVILFCVILIFSGCVRDELPTDNTMLNQEPKIAEAKSWFEDYKAKESFHPIFTTVNYHWDQATVTVLEDGSKPITIPITDVNQDPEYKGEKILYLYPFEKNYDAVVYELTPDPKQSKKSEGFQKLDSYDGYISTWDLKTGFVKGQKFVNSIAVNVIKIKIVSTDSLHSNNNISKKIAPIAPAPIELDEVIIRGSGGGGSALGYSYIVSGGSFGSNNIGHSNTGNYFNPPHGGGGGGSPKSNTKPTIDDAEPSPCDQIKNILNYNPKDLNSLKSSLNWLKDKVNAAVNDKECGVEIKKVMNPDESLKYEFTQILSNNPFSVSLATGYSYVGALHSHPTNGYAMFSYQDVRFLLSLYDGASSTRKGEVFNSVVCKDQTGKTNTYMLKIDNIDALRSQVNAVWNDPKYATLSDEEARIKEIHDKQAILYDKSNGQLEKSFLEQFKDFGISIYKADATLSSFNKLVLNNSIVTTIPCETK